MVNVHLLVLIHGMWGNTDHLAEMERIARETHKASTQDDVELHVLAAETIREESTYDGIDWGGERVAKEVMDTIKELEAGGKHVVRFSVTGYSLGGLISRYLIGVLHQRKFFDNIEPVNFNTIATPHVGLPRYPSFFSTLTSTLGPRLLSRTGEQFYCADKWSPKGRPLLVVMADPERVFYQALAKFKHIRIYANAVNDRTVPYVTAAIETSDPFIEHEINGIKLDFDEKYRCVVRSYILPDVPPPKPIKPTPLSVTWFKGLKPTKPFLPPLLQVRFPFNILVYTLLPFLIPAFALLVIGRFSLASRSSRQRIKQLEKESNESSQQKLAHVLEELEREMEDAVANFIDSDDPSPAYQPVEPCQAQPIITPNHRRIVTWLNALPIKKEIAFFPDARNSHAIIICRDVKRFEIHRQGEGVLRHWANSFIL